MKPDFYEGQDVYVPARKLDPSRDFPFGMVKTQVVAVNNAKVTVNVPSGDGRTVEIYKPFVKSDLYACVYEIGDDGTELPLLDPLAKTIHHYLRILLPDDHRVVRKFRTEDELEYFWDKDKLLSTHLVLVGHGSNDSIKTALKSIPYKSLCKILSNGMSGIGKTDILSLCCSTGRNPIAKAISEMSFCGSFIAPFDSIHGAVASQFLLSLYGHYFLNGSTMKVAFNNANENLVHGSTFKFWKDGNLQ